VFATSDAVTKPWGSHETARVLVIGHDPRLQGSSTLANYCFFADYYFRDKPNEKRELAKYQLAEALFTCIKDLTSGQFSDKEVLVTNICNEALPHPRGRKIVFIPKDKAEKGLKEVRYLLKGSQVRLIFPMSQQVNYWLQVLGFYPVNAGFVEESTPKEIGTRSDPPYYEPRRPGAFKRICGEKYTADSEYFLFPILHVKNYPLKGNFCVYDKNYANCRTEVRRVVDSLNVRR
jgi:hypothetical protein